MSSTHSRTEKKAPLYRKVNTTAHGVHHRLGDDFRSSRRSVKAGEIEPGTVPMRSGVRRGLDYTPLFRFLLSRVGEPWDEVFSEAVARLDRKDPIFWLVALRESDEKDYVCISEASYYSGLKVDEAGLLRVVNPAIDASSLEPTCRCCTHTFNGARFSRPYQESP